MLTFTSGNLLDSSAEALVNTVNTVGVMGKGIALMFKDAFPDNFKAYEAACKTKEVVIGHMFVTHRNSMYGPRFIINFPTKKHWRNPSKIDWIREGLDDLKRVIRENNIKSIALPPLGAGNGGLEWGLVRELISESLSDIPSVNITVYEPTAKYQNISKRDGVHRLTPARALIAEIVRRYSVIGIECSLLEVQKLAWFMDRSVTDLGLSDPFALTFKPNRFGPYSDELRHLLNSLDGSYLHCDKRISDASPLDVIRFDDTKREVLNLYLSSSEARFYETALKRTSDIIDGFESPFGMELLATADWLLENGVEPNVTALEENIRRWPGGAGSAERKSRIFDRRVIALALDRLQSIRTVDK